MDESARIERARVCRLTRRAGVLRLLFVASLALSGGCNRDEAAGRAAAPPPPVPVATAAAVLGDATIAVKTIGSAQSRSQVVLRPQVTGRVSNLAAVEGTDVEAGHVILTIDPRPFQAALDQAEARLAGARAQAADAARNVAQLRAVYASEAAAQREIDAADAASKMAEAAVLGAQAQVETARLDLDYCTIAAPFKGRLGEFLVKPGSIVSADDTDLVDLTQTDPIDVAFAIPEQQLGAVREAAEKGPVRVEAAPTGDPGAPEAGDLTFIDNKIDAATGTVRMKATFTNPARRLWPGRFADITVVLGVENGRVLVPESAVQPSQKGPSVFVVRPELTAEFRPVTTGRTVNGLTVIERGVQAGEIVVTDGQLRLAPGSRVQPRAAAETPAADAPAPSAAPKG